MITKCLHSLSNQIQSVLNFWLTLFKISYLINWKSFFPQQIWELGLSIIYHMTYFWLSSMHKTHGNFHQSKKMHMVKKMQSVEGKNPTCLAFSHPDWFLLYIFKTFKSGKLLYFQEFVVLTLKHVFTLDLSLIRRQTQESTEYFKQHVNYKRRSYCSERGQVSLKLSLFSWVVL